MVLLGTYTNNEEIRYFIDELERNGVKCILKNEILAPSPFPIEVGMIDILVDNKDYALALDIYSQLTGYDESENLTKHEANEEAGELEKGLIRERKKTKLVRYFILILLILMVILSIGLLLIQMSFYHEYHTFPF